MDALLWRYERDPAVPLDGRQKGPGMVHKHYCMPVIPLGTIGYAIIVVITTLRPLEGSADSMQWRHVGFVREFAFFLAVWEVEPALPSLPCH